MQPTVRALAVTLALMMAVGACGGARRDGAPSGGSGGLAGSGGASGAGGSAAAGAGGTHGMDAGLQGLDAGPPMGDAGTSPDGSTDGAAADAALDADSAHDGPFAIPALPFPIEPGEPIAAPDARWTYVALPDTRCANGTPTGIAISPITGSKGLSIFMQGGGACWNATMCLVTNTSAHLHETVGEPIVLSEAAGLSGLFDHDNAANPFASYSYVYIPYCTGDLHIGTREKTYEGPSGPRTIHHHGARNVEAILKRLVATFPDVERVLVSGISAGGYGATFNWWRYQGAFPSARVDVLDDAGLIVDPPDDRWSIMVDAWSMALPPGCTACAARMSAFLPFYGQHLVAPRRYGLVGFLSDAVIGSYFGLNGEQIRDELLARRTAAAGNQKTFYLAGPQHSVIGQGAFTVASDGASFLPWLIDFVSDAPAWDHAGP